MKQWWRDRRPYVLAPIFFTLIRFIAITLRVKLVNYEPVKDLPTGKIFCGWHGRSFIPANVFRKRGYWVIISHSRDGEFQTRVFKWLGYNVIRGSTGRGGVKALIESIKALKDNAIMAITPDGPRGPSGIVQEGVMMMARKSGCALIPVATWARPAWFIPTWDQYMIPMPFAKCVFVFGAPIYLASDSTPEEVEATRLQLQNEIVRLQDEAQFMVTGRMAKPHPE
jgi:lysophospholipid acyltransferase (LPLAT)-like uncharacterized protein